MASVQYLFSLTQTFAEEIRSKEISLVDINVHRGEWALIIQKTWRCYAARQKFKWIRARIVTLQSYCRGWHARKNRIVYVAAHRENLFQRNLNRMATVLQSSWRGYIYRKYNAEKNPKKRIKERERTDKITAEMRDYIKNAFEINKQEEIKTQIEAEKKIVLYILFKCHHLLRTEVSEGIFSCHNSNERSLIEELMKALPLKEYMRMHRKKYYDTLSKKQEPGYTFNSKQLRKYEDLLRLRDRMQDVREERKIGYSIHDQRFKFPQKECYYPKYERELAYMEKFCKPSKYPVRSTHKNLHMSSTDFLLGERMDLKDKSIPYYIDLWEKFNCDLHNPNSAD